jgi:DNA-binding NarL/FixJ family response regulator
LVAVITSILERVESTRTAFATMADPAETQESFVRDEDLSDAEWRVARAVTRGLTNKEIAAELDLSIRTVENHVSRILAKKSFSNRVEIARFLMSQGEKP